MTDKAIIATGKRKSSIARIRLRAGKGDITINARAIDNYFGRENDRRIAMQPLQLTGTATQFSILATVCGGGTTGQAGAIRHGIARALLEANPEYRSMLKEAGFLTRDSRVKERKKYGLAGARKGFQFSKR